MARVPTAFLDGDRIIQDSCQSSDQHDQQDSLKLSGFQSESFPFCPQTVSSSYCPYSVRQSQLSVKYKYDILLVYDPDENSYFVDRLLEYLSPLNLNLFDFVRDSPPGLPQRKVLQSALQVCRYTCIVITRKFITNFWMQLKTDMSIQDMLDNEQKMYSVIVVVMDQAVKRENLPLDLATLSPLFCSEKFFENRLKLAFSKEAPFPFSNESPPKNSVKKFPIDDYHLYPTAQFQSLPVQYFRSVGHNIEIGQHHTVGPDSCTRLPQEHGDSSYLMPSSIPYSLPTMDENLSMHRTISITVSSTGRREPIETTDDFIHQNSLSLNSSISMPEVEALRETNIHDYGVTSNQKSVQGLLPGHNALPVGEDSASNEIPQAESYKEDNFSYLASNHDPGFLTMETDHIKTESTEYPTISDNISSIYSDLEISLDSNSLHNQRKAPSIIKHTSASVMNTLPCNSTEVTQCQSLPVILNKGDVNSSKKSRSLLSLVGNRLFRSRKSSSSNRKKTHISSDI